MSGDRYVCSPCLATALGGRPYLAICQRFNHDTMQSSGRASSVASPHNAGLYPGALQPYTKGQLRSAPMICIEIGI